MNFFKIIKYFILFETILKTSLKQWKVTDSEKHGSANTLNASYITASFLRC